MREKLLYSWFGAGWASYKVEAVTDIHMPLKENLTEWLNGFFAAHADYPDSEAMQGILRGDFTQGEQAEDALLRIAPQIYVMVSESPELIQKYKLKI